VIVRHVNIGDIVDRHVYIEHLWAYVWYEDHMSLKVFIDA